MGELRLVPINGRPDRSPDRVITIPTPWEKPLLSLNDSGASRGAVMARNEVVSNLRSTMMVLCRRHQVPKGCEFVEARLHYLPDVNRRRDTDNCVATLKPLCDALAEGTRRLPGYGVVPDDTPTWMAKPEPVIYHPLPGVKARVWMVLTLWEHNS